MNEKSFFATMMWGMAALAAISGIAAVVLLAQTITDSFWLVIPAVLAAAAVGGCCYGAVYFAGRVKGQEKVFSNPIEQEVLTNRQRRELKQKRGEIVMQRSLIEIENERDNMLHRQLEVANDPTKPPHQTRFGTEEEPKKIKAKECTCGPIWTNMRLATVMGTHHSGACPMYDN